MCMGQRRQWDDEGEATFRIDGRWSRRADEVGVDAAACRIEGR